MNVKDFTRPRVPMAALCLFALCALTVPASALAAGHRGTNAHGAKLVVKKKSKKKPKKKPPTPVIVKCASVTVTCKGTPGATGPQGPTGLNGANGSAVVLRARGAGTVEAGPEKLPPGCESYGCVEGQNVPLSPSTWTEGPTEDDQMLGSLTLSVPSEAECNAGTKPMVFVIPVVDGIAEGLIGAEGGTTAVTLTPSLFAQSYFKLELEEAEPGIAFGTGFFLADGESHAHTVTVKVFDNCVTKHATVSNVAIDVLASF